MKDKILETIGKSLTYTRSVAETMPEEFYTSRLTSFNWSFAEMLEHISYGIGWWQVNMMEGVQTEWAPPAVATSKREIIGHLEKAFNALSEKVSKLTIDDAVIYGSFATLDHVTHHRGQLILFIRKQGLTPPEYTF